MSKLSSPLSLENFLVENGYENITMADGMEAAAIGVVERCGQPPIVIYDYEKCVKLYMGLYDASEEEAREYVDFNCVGAWVGPETPGWLKIRVPEP